MGTRRRLIESARGADLQPYEHPQTALRWMRRCAWHDLQHARSWAQDGVWSLACESAVERIVGLTRLIGPEPRDSVPTALVDDGLYDLLHEAAGFPPPKDPA